MNEPYEPSATLDQPRGRRTAAERFAHLSDRLSRSLPHAGRITEPAEPDDDYPLQDEQTEWFHEPPRFPIVRSGYDCEAVEEHIEMLERELSELDHELAELRARPPAQDEVAAEIQRVGEQTSAILLAAHDRARETAREAQEQADRCLADAASSALSITEEANRKKGEAEQETRRLMSERERLLKDLEALAGTLASIAREAGERFPATSES
ncbi:MAG TPA: DivIVA domain-containing protein [Solirubrobacteraceae bacterium]|nr:DivIVA domain-containing protein [Solirubrobacteraceae bacterium]